ncbi:nuclear transport factor 2 family protein [Halarcobacter sp.]|uniref:nuclear transport factor 2 family protein n=1 Tax=Halarcobacter sp. TaxID=2321133 RepID=UPI0029F57CCA|nr:nuclear transport factor 2 family protein [Halarcobacter sp.]
MIYADFFENIDKDTSIHEFAQVFDLNAKFKDPFHEVKGLDEIYKVFQKMYENLDNPRFTILDTMSEKNISYIKWEFSFYFKKQLVKQSFIGLSRVVFNSDNKAISHEDFWDVGENIYEKIPFISSIIKFVKNKIKS